MVHHSTQSDDYLWHLILRGRRKKINKHTQILSSSPFSLVGTKMCIDTEYSINMGKNIFKVDSKVCNKVL